MTGSFELVRTHSAHIGSSPLVSARARTSVDANPNAEGMKSVTGGFEGYLLDAMNYVNGKQMASAGNVEKLITDPDSVDIHDITTAMAEASMSLSLAQTVINRLVNSWNEITTTR